MHWERKEKERNTGNAGDDGGGVPAADADGGGDTRGHALASASMM